MLLLQGILPLIAYLLAETFLGVRKAVIIAFAIAAVEIIWSRIAMGYFEPTGLISAALIGVMGAISYRMNSPLMFKLQPVVLGVIFAGVLAWFQFFDEPLIFKMFPLMRELMSPEQAAQLDDPAVRALLGRICGQMIGVFLVHAAIVAIAAVRWNRWVWFLIRSLGIYLLVFALVVVNILLVQPR